MKTITVILDGETFAFTVAQWEVLKGIVGTSTQVIYQQPQPMLFPQMHVPPPVPTLPLSQPWETICGHTPS